MAPRKGKHPYAGPNAARLRAAAGLSAPRDFSYPNLSPLFGHGQGFSMRDEAKNTMSHQSTWGQDARLRAKPVAFVSTGFTEPLNNLKADEESDVIMAEKSVSERDIDAGEAYFGDTAAESHLTSVELVGASVEVEMEQEASTPALEIPTEADVPAVVDKGNGSPARPNDSPCDVTPSFFFDLDGDTSLHQVRSPVIIPSRASSPARSDSSEEVILFRGRSGQTQRSTPHTSHRVEPADKPTNPPKPESRQECLPPGNSSAHPGRSTAIFTSRRKRARSARHAMQTRRAPQEDQEDEEENDEDQILADYIANMAAQSEEDMIPRLLNSFNNRRDLGGEDDAFDFGSENGDERGSGKRLAKDDSDEASDSDNDDDQDDAGDTSDNDMPSGLNDESLARLLAKQEELDMGADKLLLFSEAFAKMGSQNGGGNQSSKKARLNNGSVADALDNLDLTDWNQGDFRKPGRARRNKQPPAFNVSDSELDMALRTAWSTDRERKKNRKMERELLRSQGLLGKNVNPDDLRVKYQSHMTLDDIKSELVAFLIDSAETIQFPPMDKEARKTVHLIAVKLNIKSQSTGKGDQRRPVLDRTKRTTVYARSSIREATNHVERASIAVTKRQYFHRSDKKTPWAPGAKRSGHKAVTYREGEIVGASAPQLGQENKGHAMLEKMGWSRGMALGTLENKGILEPIAQVVKQSKAGLG